MAFLAELEPAGFQLELAEPEPEAAGIYVAGPCTVTICSAMCDNGR